MSDKFTSSEADDLRDVHRGWLRRVLDELDLSLNKLALGAGVSSSTLSRFLNDPSHPHALSVTTINKIVRHYGVEPPPMSLAHGSVDEYRKAVWNVVYALYQNGALQGGGADATADTVLELADWLMSHADAPEQAAPVISFAAEKLKRRA